MEPIMSRHTAHNWDLPKLQTHGSATHRGAGQT